VTAEGLWWDLLRGAGQVVVSLLLVLAAIFPLLRLGPKKLAWDAVGSTLQRRLIRSVDVAAAVLPLVPLATWAVLALPVIEDADVAPWWAVIPALLLAGVGLGWAYLRSMAGDGPRQTAVDRVESTLRSGLGVMATVAVLAFLVVGTLVAVVGDAAYGGAGLGALTLGAIVAWVLYRLLGGVANWRWQAWDEQEREQFRQSLDPSDRRVSRRPWGRLIDQASIGFACVAAVVLAAAIGAPFIRPGTAASAAVAVGVLVVAIWLIGVAQDAANSRSGVKPTEMTPLPTSAA
jgi:hypothetical protein